MKKKVDCLELNLSQSKSDFRSEILSRISGLSRQQKQTYSESIQQNLKMLLASKNNLWTGFKALRDEPQINWLEVSPDISWCFPRVEANELKFAQAARQWTPSSLGVLEPQDGVDVRLSVIEGFIIPGVAFSRRGVRLGRGKGFYDRTLFGSKALKVGVCFEVSFCENLPHEEHDVCCDVIVTEKQVYKVVSSKGEIKWS